MCLLKKWKLLTFIENGFISCLDSIGSRKWNIFVYFVWCIIMHGSVSLQIWDEVLSYLSCNGRNRRWNWVKEKWITQGIFLSICRKQKVFNDLVIFKFINLLFLIKNFNFYYLILINSYTEYPTENILPPFISTKLLASSRINLLITMLTYWCMIVQLCISSPIIFPRFISQSDKKLSSPILLYTKVAFSLEALLGSGAVLFWGCIREREGASFIWYLLPLFYVSWVSLQYKHFQWANYHSEGKSHSQLLSFVSQSMILLYGLLYLPRLG